MKVNLPNINREYRITQQQIAVNAILGERKSTDRPRDIFIRSGNATNDAGLYSPFTLRKNTSISEALLLLINNDISKVRKHGEVYEYAGVRFTADQIPKVDTSSLSEVKACNNIMDFGQNQYFKYVSADGKEHALFTDDKGIGTVYSEYMRGAEHDAVGVDYAKFWRYMTSKDPVYYGLSWSREEVQEYMSEAGIEHGFFTVKMGDREATQYYTKSKTSGVIQSKERYDSKYEHITSTGYELMNYEPGSVFKLNGKEYVLSENHTLDIPYGEDLWCLENPSNYRWGEKID